MSFWTGSTQHAVEQPVLYESLPVGRLRLPYLVNNCEEEVHDSLPLSFQVVPEIIFLIGTASLQQRFSVTSWVHMPSRAGTHVISPIRLVQ